jgi:hypothetical protein
VFRELNAGRRKRFDEELDVIRSLPAKRLGDYTSYLVTVRGAYGAYGTLVKY